LFAAPESSPAILFGLYDVLGSVGAVYPDMTTGQEGEALIDLIVRPDGEVRHVSTKSQTRFDTAGRPVKTGSIWPPSITVTPAQPAGRARSWATKG
jgi:hypothetical protein